MRPVVPWYDDDVDDVDYYYYYYGIVVKVPTYTYIFTYCMYIRFSIGETQKSHDAVWVLKIGTENFVGCPKAGNSPSSQMIHNLAKSIEMWKKKREYYHIISAPEGTERIMVLPEVFWRWWNISSRVKTASKDNSLPTLRSSPRTCKQIGGCHSILIIQWYNYIYCKWHRISFFNTNKWPCLHDLKNSFYTLTTRQTLVFFYNFNHHCGFCVIKRVKFKNINIEV